MATSPENLKFNRIALLIQYQGSGFCGWQRQKVGLTVQGVLEDSIFSLEPYHSIKLIANVVIDSIP